MTVRADVQQLSPLDVVTMFEWNATALGDSQPFYWHAGTTFNEQPIHWQGIRYEPLPIEATDFEMSNIGGLLGAYLRAMKDALGAKVIRRRTLGKYLDAANFPGNVNPYADPTTYFPDEVYYVARKASENALFIEIELAVRFDVEGVNLPRRQVIAGTCQWVYRSAECSYAGGPVQDIYGAPTSDPAADRCRKTLDACKARFGQYGVLRTSAFPASLLVRQ
jgi:lambda family phage minor tail protein L